MADISDLKRVGHEPRRVSIAALWAIKAVIAHAIVQHTVPHGIVERLAKATRTPELATMNNDKCVIIGQFFVTYTHEEQKPGVICRHVSIAVASDARPGDPSVTYGNDGNEDTMTPTIDAIEVVMWAFHFVNDFASCPKYIEELGAGRNAINIIEPLDGDLTKIQKVRP